MSVSFGECPGLLVGVAVSLPERSRSSGGIPSRRRMHSLCAHAVREATSTDEKNAFTHGNYAIKKTSRTHSHWYTPPFSKADDFPLLHVQTLIRILFRLGIMTDDQYGCSAVGCFSQQSQHDPHVLIVKV